MAINITGAEDSEVTLFLNSVLDAYKNGLCNRSDARAALWQVLDSAIKQYPNFMTNVRTNTMLFPDA